jgi:hypothetical protein
VYGGGRLGLMGVVADAALAAGGEVAGVIPHGLVDRELAHGGLTELHVVETMHERVDSALGPLLEAMDSHRPPRPRFPDVDPGVEPAAQEGLAK